MEKSKEVARKILLERTWLFAVSERYYQPTGSFPRRENHESIKNVMAGCCVASTTALRQGEMSTLHNRMRTNGSLGTMNKVIVT